MAKRQATDSASWFARDVSKRQAYLDSDAYAQVYAHRGVDAVLLAPRRDAAARLIRHVLFSTPQALDTSPFLRLWCLVEMAAALEHGKPLVFKVAQKVHYSSPFLARSISTSLSNTLSAAKSGHWELGCSLGLDYRRFLSGGHLQAVGRGRSARRASDCQSDQPRC